MQELPKIFFVVATVLLALFLPIKFGAKLNYNLLKNKGNICVNFFCFKIFLAKFSFKIFYLELISKGKTKRIYPSNISRPNDFLQAFALAMFKFVRPKTLKAIANIGSQTNAFATCYCCGAIASAITSSASALLQAKKPRLTIQIFPSFFQNNFIFSLTSSLRINLFAIAISLAVAPFLVKKGDNHHVKQQNAS